MHHVRAHVKVHINFHFIEKWKYILPFSCPYNYSNFARFLGIVCKFRKYCCIRDAFLIFAHVFPIYVRVHEKGTFFYFLIVTFNCRGGVAKLFL